MDKYNTVILGGGPAGLSAAHTLSDKNIDVVLCDKNETMGGLCRSFTIDGFIFDTFAHVNFSKDSYVQSMLEEKTDYLIHKPEAYNYSNGVWIRNPVQNNLINLDIDERIKIIKGFIERKKFNPQNYGQWLRMQYGDYFTDNYPSKYTRKYWTVESELLETKWVEGRMYTPSIDEVLYGAMSSETPNVHYTKEIHYPVKGGFGAFMSSFSGDYAVENKKEYSGLDIKNKEVFFTDGESIKYDNLISTIPLDILVKGIKGDVPEKVLNAVNCLDYTSGVIVSIGLNKKHRSPSLWFYIYDEDILPARVYCPDIKSPQNVPNGCSSLQAEVYFSKYKLLNIDLSEIKEKVVEQLIDIGLFEKENIMFSDVRFEKYANIMFTKQIYEARSIVHQYLKSIGVHYAGRFGEWDYLWTGQSILSGRKCALELSVR